MNTSAQTPLATIAEDKQVLFDEAPVVIVGNGPVGVQAARELLRRTPEQSLVIYGKEPWQPYNRVQLSSLLAGEQDLAGLTTELANTDSLNVEQRYGCAVTSVNPESHTVTDSSGQNQPYRKLVLATGSRPLVPDIPGHTLPGVFTFRDLSDAQRLMARRARSRRTLVIGGGLLGIEAARGMQKANTEVIIVDHADRLLNRQLNEQAAHRLHDYIESKRVQVVLNGAVKEINGDGKVEGVTLYSGRTIHCDTVIIAVGIVPNTELAKAAGVKTGRGIKVDDAMQSSIPDIYAVGECAEHRGQVYGLVAPGLEQAAVAIHNLCGGSSRYSGSIAATQLKVLDENVFSAGPIATHQPSSIAKTLSYSSATAYRRILVRRFRLEGALAIGDWPEQNRILNAVTNHQWVMPWQLWRFRSSGKLWLEAESQTVAQWPANTKVCQCSSISRGQISDAIGTGACSVAEITRTTGAGGVCGSCKPLLKELLGTQATAEAVRWSPGLTISAVLALLAALLFFTAPSIPYSSSVQTSWQWDVLWRDGLLKQISGFTVLGLFVIGLAITPRKRWRKFHNMGQFDVWRIMHIVTGMLVLTVLFAHTGLRLGHGLNLWLTISFIGLLFAGALLTLSISFEHRLDTTLARRLRSTSLWLHLLLFWPVPALLGFHILKSYYF